MIGRTRKKKCDERRPACQRCLTLGWDCEWPTSEALIDRRRASVRHQQSNAVPRRDSKLEERLCTEGKGSCSSSVSTDHRALSPDITPLIYKHFVDKYYPLILLPNCHPKYYWVFLHKLELLLPEYPCLQYTVLASAASHLHSTLGSAQMQELSLTYYSQALQSLQELLASASRLENNNGLLMSIMLLYTLGVSRSAASLSP